MGNAAGVGPSIAGSSDTGVSLAEAESASVDYSSEDQLEQLASKFKVSKAKLQTLRTRFEMLGPDEDGLLNRKVFQKPPYSTDPFCRQIWKRLSGVRGASDKISFPSFVRTMVWWEKAPTNFKLEMFFSWMKDVDGITPELLARILNHILPEYKQEEHQKMAEQMIATMSGTPTSSPHVLQLEDFMNWFGKIPEEKLKEALDFQILHIDAGSGQ